MSVNEQQARAVPSPADPKQRTKQDSAISADDKRPSTSGKAVTHDLRQVLDHRNQSRLREQTRGSTDRLRSLEGDPSLLYLSVPTQGLVQAGTDKRIGHASDTISSPKRIKRNLNHGNTIHHPRRVDVSQTGAGCHVNPLCSRRVSGKCHTRRSRMVSDTCGFDRDRLTSGGPSYEHSQSARADL
jgi:hypothetical protein